MGKNGIIIPNIFIKYILCTVIEMDDGNDF